MVDRQKQIRWVGPALKEVRTLPAAVRAVAGFGLYQAQQGDKYVNAKPLQGFPGAGVLEIVVNTSGNTFRVVYTTRYHDAIYVLCAFQKKATRGKKTSERNIRLIRSRLRAAEEYDRDRLARR